MLKETSAYQGEKYRFPESFGDAERSHYAHKVSLRSYDANSRDSAAFVCFNAQGETNQTRGSEMYSPKELCEANTSNRLGKGYT